MFRCALIGLLLLAFGRADYAYAAGTCGRGGQVAGAVVGGIAGGLLGRAAGGKTAGVVAGGLIGAFVGSKLGQALDQCEREKMSEATQAALDSPGAGATSQKTWQSDTRSGTRGEVSASQVERSTDGRLCRTATQVNYVDGKEMQDSTKFCQSPPSKTWKPA